MSKKQIQTNRGLITVAEEIFTEGDAKRNGYSYSFTARTYDGELIGDIWSRYGEKGINYPEMVIVKPYLNRHDIPGSVMDNISDYLEEHNLGQLAQVFRMSNHPEDWYLYGVIAKNGDTFSCWTSWNETTQSLNFGHYGLETFQDAVEIIKEHYHDCTEV